MTTEIRLLDPATEAEAAMRVFRTAVVEAPPSPEDIDLDGIYYRVGTYHGAFVDGRLVGVAGILPFELTVPGGAQVPSGGITAVGVLPTHTRRGLLT
ncbi:MAG TPA: GNAT family N-acetyltransferase, partial [Acidimicrobiales bacterium]